MADGPKKIERLPFVVESCDFKTDIQIDFATLEGIDDDKIMDWPVVYVLNNKKEVYIGQTTSLQRRTSQHGSNKEKAAFNRLNVIFSEEFNMSVVTDYESRLIQLMHADELFSVTNKNGGISNADYFSKAEYGEMFSDLWEQLRNFELASHSIAELENSVLFKYSPFKELNSDQEVALRKILDTLGDKKKAPMVVEGIPGSGKTVLAVFLFKALKDSEEYKDKNIKLVIPQTSLRGTLQKVFRQTMNLDPKDVIGPSELMKVEKGYVSGKKNNYDILLIDEAHRLRQRKNVMNHATFIANNEVLGLNPFDGELDWVLDQCATPIFFFDALQTVGPSSTNQKKLFSKVKTAEPPIVLSSQMRVKGGTDYIGHVSSILNSESPDKLDFSKTYEFGLFESFEKFEQSFVQTLGEHNLTRMMAGYAWPWKTKGNKPGFDIEIEGIKKRWNRGTNNWVGKGLEDYSIATEMGSIHSLQGYDLSYSFVVFGNDIIYNPNTNEIEVVKENYFDKNGKNNTTPEELLQYIKNIYYVFLTRGINGTFCYACDENLRKYLSKFMNTLG